MSVSIKQLKAFVAVVEEKSFSQAAERLNATQSGMSTVSYTHLTLPTTG